MDDGEGSVWLGASDATDAAITAARASGDWGYLDEIARLLQIRDDPASRGAWETICHALCTRNRG